MRYEILTSVTNEVYFFLGWTSMQISAISTNTLQEPKMLVPLYQCTQYCNSEDSYHNTL